jgi:uncharacterized protein (AIM24 family)
MNYMEEGISFEAKMGDGSKPVGGLLDSLMHVGMLVLTGESIFITHFTNQSQEKKKSCFCRTLPRQNHPAGDGATW